MNVKTPPRTMLLSFGRGRGWAVIGALLALGCVSATRAAELSVSDLKLRPGATGAVIVSGRVADEATIGVTIMLELRPRAGAAGSLTFTPVQSQAAKGRPTVSVTQRLGQPALIQVKQAVNGEVDIAQIDDPWPDRGTFSPLDTDLTGAVGLNGAVDDNGTFVPETLTFAGDLASFPVRATPEARGEWDIVLATSAGESNWQGLETRLIAGRVVVARDACVSDGDCYDKNACTIDSCRNGFCVHTAEEGDCTDDRPARKDRGGPRDRAGGESEP